MDDIFYISVTHNGQEYELETRISSTGYTHKFHVIINGITVVYEPDEERKYRAIIDTADMSKLKDLDIALIQLVGEQIESMRE